MSSSWIQILDEPVVLAITSLIIFRAWAQGIYNTFIWWWTVISRYMSHHDHHHHTSGFESRAVEPLLCDLCKTRFDSREEFREHLRIKHNIPTWPTTGGIHSSLPFAYIRWHRYGRPVHTFYNGQRCVFRILEHMLHKRQHIVCRTVLQTDCPSTSGMQKSSIRQHILG